MEWNGRGYNGGDSRFGKSSLSLFFCFFIEMILLLLVFWECGVGERVQFGRFHTRTPERERGREKVSCGVCVC